MAQNMQVEPAPQGMGQGRGAHQPIAVTTGQATYAPLTARPQGRRWQWSCKQLHRLADGEI